MSVYEQQQIDVLIDKQPLQPPAKYRVVLLNDDVTPMDLVVRVLMRVFAMHRDQAEKTMLQAHHQGRVVCGIYMREIAETKAAEAVDMAGHYPLRCIIERWNGAKRDRIERIGGSEPIGYKGRSSTL